MAENFFYMTTVGHKTGKEHQIEIWFVELDACYYLCSEMYTKAHWVQNIMAQPKVSYYVEQGRDKVPTQTYRGRAQALTEESEKLQKVRALFDAKYNWSTGLIVEISPE